MSEIFFFGALWLTILRVEKVRNSGLKLLIKKLRKSMLSDEARQEDKIQSGEKMGQPQPDLSIKVSQFDQSAPAQQVEAQPQKGLEDEKPEAQKQARPSEKLTSEDEQRSLLVENPKEGEGDSQKLSSEALDA